MSMSLTGTLEPKDNKFAIHNTNYNNNSIMSQSMDGPRSFLTSPAKTYSNNSTLDRRYGNHF